jgi:hypothetical protein
MEEGMVVVPMSVDFQTSLQTASLLWRVESKQDTGEGKKFRSHHAIFTLANLFLCGYFDELIRNDPGTHYLTLFIGLETALSMLFTIAYFIGSVREVLQKTKSYPISSSARFLFVLLSALRRPIFLGFFFTNCFFLCVFFWKTRVLMGWAVILYSLLMLDVQLIVAVLAVLYEKISFAGVGVILLFISFVLVTSSVLFHQDYLFGGLPLIQWVVNGLTAVRTGEESRAMFYIDAMAGIMVLLFLSGIRLVKE